MLSTCALSTSSYLLRGLTVAMLCSSSSDSETEQPLRKQPRTDGAGAAALAGVGECPAAQAWSATGEPLGAAGSAGLAAAGARPAARPQGTAAAPSGVPGSAALGAAGACTTPQAPSLAGGLSGATATAPGGLEGAAPGFQAALMQRVGASSLSGAPEVPSLAPQVGSEAAMPRPGGDGASQASKGACEGEAGLGIGSEVTDGAESGRGSRGSSQTRSGLAVADRPS